MTVTINGTTGIAGTNGSAGTPAVQGEDTNTGIFFPAADTVAVATAGAERLRVDSSGNVGIGVTPSAWDGAIFKSIDIGGVYKNSFYGQANGDWTAGVGTNHYYNSGWKYASTGAASRYEVKSNQHAWYTAPSGTAGNAITFTQAMTLDASGNLLVGTTSSSAKLTVNATGDVFSATSGADALVMISKRGNNGDHIRFLNSSSVTAGNIGVTNTTTYYNTSSDYRLKENVAPMQDALDTVAQLNPVTYTWKADGSAGQGFIAHELQAVVPDCVTGEKDAVDAEGNPQYQGVDTSFLVATLVAAIKEQQAIITDLTARVAQLEAQ